MSDDPSLFDLVDHALRTSGPQGVLDGLLAAMEERGDPRGLLDALLLKARHDLGLPPVAPATLSDLPEPVRTQYEDRYVEAIRHVGGRLLREGNLVAAWPYFRAIGEKEPIVAALDAFQPGDSDESVGHVVEVAFNAGAHPRRGFELILDHFGVCSAITAFEGLPPDESLRVVCAEKLTRRLHEHLTASLRAEIERQGLPIPPEGTSVPALIAGRDWLFEDDAYHLDVSHLASVVRMSPMLADPEVVALAAELADYGARLSHRHKYASDPPFENLYEDHALYLRGVLGIEVEAAIAHFRERLPAVDPDGDGDSMPAQVLVRLLLRLDRLDEAIEVSAEHLALVPEGALMVPGISQLCARAGRMQKLAEVAKMQGDVVRYAAAILPATARGQAEPAGANPRG